MYLLNIHFEYKMRTENETGCRSLLQSAVQLPKPSSTFESECHCNQTCIKGRYQSTEVAQGQNLKVHL